jgi:transcriptional regulator with XRE-family HTH domain
LLNLETINKILSLLENGFSWRKTAKLADVSVSTVQRIANGKRFSTGQKPVSESITALVNSNVRVPIELRGDALRRYIEVRDKKNKQPTNQS